MSYTLTTKISWAQTMSELRDEFNRWGVSKWDITVPRGHRLTSWNQTEEDRTVTLSFFKDNKEVVLTYGKQSRAVDNIRALYLTINDMRMTEKRGVGDLVGSAYKQLGDGGNAPRNSAETKSPYEILGIREDSDLETAEAVYRSLSKKYHPDSKPDGSVEKMKILSQAISEIRKIKR